MDSRIPLSPKKLRCSNILPPSCPVSLTKKLRSSAVKTCSHSPSKVKLTPSRRQASPSKAKTNSLAHSPTLQSLTISRQGSPVKVHMAPLKVFSDDTVYATHLDTQLANNSDLVLSPPRDVPKISPSPQKRTSPQSAISKQRSSNRPVFGVLGESTRMPRLDAKDSLTLSQNSFLTPPRPRLHGGQSSLADEDRITKSASPKLGRAASHSDSLERSQNQGFTIFVDQSEYISLANGEFEIGEGVNKENYWLSKTQLLA